MTDASSVIARLRELHKRVDAMNLAKLDEEAAILNALPPLLSCAEALGWMVELCHHANPTAFSNGVTDSTGSIDEGDVIASRIMGDARAALAALAKVGGAE